jgi:hypothetical protein
VYACAEKAALLDRLGKGRTPEIIPTIGVRGDIEGFVTLPNGPVVGAAVQLSRGGFTVHAAAKDVPAPLRLLLANAKPRIEPTTAGFAIVNFGRMLAALGDKAPPRSLVEGVTLDALVKSLAGPLTLTIENGASAFDLRVPLNDEVPARRLVAQCDEMNPLDLLGAVVVDGVCHVENAMLNARLDGWIDAKTLRVGDRKHTSSGVRSEMSRAAQQLASGEWTVAVLGRGTMFAPMTLKIPPEAFPPEDQTSLRALTLFTEVGAGVRLDGEVVRGMVTVRTLWENPDDVVEKLIAIDLGGVITGKAAIEAKAIADAAPRSPFAADYKAGMFSLFVPLALLGGLQEAATSTVGAYVKW